jgi:hypothetical protein
MWALAGDAGERVTLVAEKVCEGFCRAGRFADDGGVVHDTAQPAGDDRGSEGQTAAGDPIRCRRSPAPRIIVL